MLKFHVGDRVDVGHKNKWKGHNVGVIKRVMLSYSRPNSYGKITKEYRQYGVQFKDGTMLYVPYQRLEKR